MFDELVVAVGRFRCSVNGDAAVNTYYMHLYPRTAPFFFGYTIATPCMMFIERRTRPSIPYHIQYTACMFLNYRAHRILYRRMVLLLTNLLPHISIIIHIHPHATHVRLHAFLIYMYIY
jgi:hypothetical protein